jgi:hypothetical protein
LRALRGQDGLQHAAVAVKASMTAGASKAWLRRPALICLKIPPSPSRSIASLAGLKVRLMREAAELAVMIGYQPRNAEEAWQVADDIVLSGRAAIP